MIPYHGHLKSSLALTKDFFKNKHKNEREGVEQDSTTLIVFVVVVVFFMINY